jgi:hypothetical protein
MEGMRDFCGPHRNKQIVLESGVLLPCFLLRCPGRGHICCIACRGAGRNLRYYLKIPLNPSNISQMNGGYQGVDGPAFSLMTRLLSAIPATVGAGLLAAAIAACGSSASATQNLPTAAGGGTGRTSTSLGASPEAVPGREGSAGAGAPASGKGATAKASLRHRKHSAACPTKGVGGDPVAPLCASLVTSQGEPRPGITLPPTPSATPTSSATSTDAEPNPGPDPDPGPNPGPTPDPSPEAGG